MENINEGAYRITGVPGAGKTTFLARQVERACETHGRGSVVVASFTKAAAAEVAERDTPLGSHQIGTLHSFAFNAIGKPRLIEDKKGIAEWNEHIGKKKTYLRLTVSDAPDTDDLGFERNFDAYADQVYAKYNQLRNRLAPHAAWPSSVKDFAAEWEGWKREAGGIDFTDMLEIALRDTDAIPFRPSVGFLDEANDSSRLQLALWDKWSRSFDYNIIAGDADQVLYDWAGVDVGAFLDLPISDSHKKYLTQSHRCPRAVADYANKIIKKCRKRDPIEMLPRAADGKRYRLHATYKYPEPAVKEAQKYIAEGKTVAFLTTCSYMLAPLLAVLKGAALPFENKYRRKRGDWNPLFSGRGQTTASRITAFLNDGELWDASQLRSWIELVEAKEILARGAKTQIENSDSYEWEDLKRWFAPCWPEPIKQDLSWLQSKMLPKAKKKAEYPAAIIKRHGKETLQATPQITVGTVHSVKGATFDVVFLFPDLSRQGYESYMSEPDAIYRVWYVGATRARETLVLCEAATPLNVDL